jgi:ABC-type lipoprotein release transport system permease subunit
LPASRFLGTFSYGVSTSDPLTYLGVTIARDAMALLAAWFPARRAAIVGPMTALQTE